MNLLKLKPCSCCGWIPTIQSLIDPLTRRQWNFHANITHTTTEEIELGLKIGSPVKIESFGPYATKMNLSKLGIKGIK